ncbi:Transcriptional regulator, AsnC family [Pyrodictium delaneyi]|uniref:AsnC family transcriptional regulator n=1 Tax=Pyrodictium delaneyi TaxID=1273541 RepID=A0A0P0N271_9CREN|nr:Lrp/AsnC family transcriptional regulator [Pyrodictium delaneyi]ALL00693.1 Transcriptional regulator, AsnC family [Pyrodictium delaneyi]OWJ54138.1 AsnC family transcriptional regulator [Pyrodictium delaneyi]
MTGLGVDETDLKLIRLLAKDSRRSIRDLARELGLAGSTVHARLRRLVENRVIKRFTILPDYDALGYNVTAIVLLQVEGGKILDAGEYIARDPSVMAVYDITGDYDLAVIAKFRNVNELDRFLKKINRLPYVRRSVTSLVLRSIKEDFVSPLTG